MERQMTEIAMHAELADVTESTRLERAAELLAGKRPVTAPPASAAEIHKAAVEGVPYASLRSLLKELRDVPADDVAQALGLSLRTLQRKGKAPAGEIELDAMPPDLGSRTWQLAETLALAEDVMGGRAEAVRWLTQRAMGLDGMRPIELLRTLHGARLVAEFLERLRFGLYV